MAKDFESLKQQALVIKNEVEDGANSSERIGGILEDILDYNNDKLTELENKSNDIVTNIEKNAFFDICYTIEKGNTDKILIQKKIFKGDVIHIFCEDLLREEIVDNIFINDDNDNVLATFYENGYVKSIINNDAKDIYIKCSSGNISAKIRIIKGELDKLFIDNSPSELLYSLSFGESSNNTQHFILGNFKKGEPIRFELSEYYSDTDTDKNVYIYNPVSETQYVLYGVGSKNSIIDEDTNVLSIVYNKTGKTSGYANGKVIVGILSEYVKELDVIKPKIEKNTRLIDNVSIDINYNIKSSDLAQNINIETPFSSGRSLFIICRNFSRKNTSSDIQIRNSDNELIKKFTSNGFYTFNLDKSMYLRIDVSSNTSCDIQIVYNDISKIYNTNNLYVKRDFVFSPIENYTYDTFLGSFKKDDDFIFIVSNYYADTTLDNNVYLKDEINNKLYVLYHGNGTLSGKLEYDTTALSLVYNTTNKENGNSTVELYIGGLAQCYFISKTSTTSQKKGKKLIGALYFGGWDGESSQDTYHYEESNNAYLNSPLFDEDSDKYDPNASQYENWFDYVKERRGITPTTNSTFYLLCPDLAPEILPSRKPLLTGGWRMDNVDRMEEEIELASKYMIDYFLFCFYTKNYISEDGVVDDAIMDYPLNKCIQYFISASNTNKMKFAVMVENSGYNLNEKQTISLIKYIKDKFISKDNYLFFDGNPLIAWFGEPYLQDDIYKQYYNITTYKNATSDTNGFDGSFYYISTRNLTLGENSFGFADSDSLEVNKAAMTSSKILANATIGKDNRPWGYPWGEFEGKTASYITKPTKDEWLKSLKDRIDLIKSQQGDNSILIYAWNELGEGGWLLPTEGEPNYDRLECILDAKKYWIVE